MRAKISLKEIERNMYRQSIQDGIIDIQIGSILLIFAVAPHLSEYLGDFWSSLIFLPFWGLIYLALRTVRKKYLQPRIGQIQYRSSRKKRLKSLTLSIFIFNLLALGAGFLFLVKFPNFPESMPMVVLSILLMTGFSLAGYLLELPRFYAYGSLYALAPLIGEYLYITYTTPHHGLPITFGIASGLLILIGLVIMIRIITGYPLPDQEYLA